MDRALTAGDIRRLFTTNAWEERTLAHAAADQYLRDAHRHRAAGNDAAADMCDRAYWDEIDNEETR